MNDNEENAVRPQRPLGAGEGRNFGGGTEGMSRIGKGERKEKTHLWEVPVDNVSQG